MSCYAVMNALMRPDLSPNESRLLAYLVFRANGARVCWPSVPEIMADLSMSRRTVISGTARLASDAIGAIKIRRRFKERNLYTILPWAGMEDMPKFTGSAPAVNESESEPDICGSPLDCNEPVVSEGAKTDTCEEGETDTSAPLEGAESDTSTVQNLTQHLIQQESNKTEDVAAQRQRLATQPGLFTPANDRVVPDKGPENNFWTDGVRIVRERLRMNRQKAGGMLRTFRDDAKGSEAIVLEVLQAAERENIREGFVGWVREGIKARLAPKPTFSTPAGRIADKMGLNEPARRAAFWGDWGNANSTDYDDFEREAGA